MHKVLSVCLFLVIITSVHAQLPKDSINSLVFEGAGIRGIAYAGALAELDEAGALSQIERAGGTSAGALMALLVSLEYSPEEIYSIIESTDFEAFNDGSMFLAGGVQRLTKNQGWYRTQEMEHWLEGLINSKTGNPDITLGEWAEQSIIDVYLTCTFLNYQELVYLSHETYPEMRLADAALAAMCIPLYFEPVRFDAHGHRPSEFSPELAIALDGGMISNFPITMFDHIPSACTLGFRIDDDAQIQMDAEQQGLAYREVNDLRTFVEAFYILTLESSSRQNLTPYDWQRTISVNCGDIGPRIQALDTTEKNMMMQNGRKAVQVYFQE